MKITHTFFAFMLLLLVFTAAAQPQGAMDIYDSNRHVSDFSNVNAFLYQDQMSSVSLPPETAEDYDQRMLWWKDARYGMFIHWGLYSLLEGEYNGKITPKIAEWIQNTLHIPLAEYKKLVGQFNPVRFNAHAWAKLAKDAGMKYIVLVSKHHDGFAMFDSRYSEYDMMSTPYKKDIVKELKEACHKIGLRFGLYYSHNIDWEHAQNFIPYTASNKGKTYSWMNLTDYNPSQMNKESYLNEKGYPQLRELLTNYGKIDILWFDMGSALTNTQVRSFVKICRDLQPDILISSRVGTDVDEQLANRGMLFDFYTPDDNYFTGDDLPMPWEMVGTTNNSWGYRKDDNHWRSPEQILHTLLACASRNGNYMLNMGPMANGLMPEAPAENLLGVGVWLREYGESVYGTTGSPFKNNFEWGYITQKKGKLYLNITKWPADNKLFLPGLLSMPTAVYALGDKKNIKFESRTSALEIYLDGIKKHPLSTTLVLVCNTDNIRVSDDIVQGMDNIVRLDRIGGAYRPSQKLSTWNFTVEKPGAYNVCILSNEKGSHLKPVWTGADQQGAIEVAGQVLPVKLQRSRETINPSLFFYKEITSDIGTIHFNKKGTYTLVLKNMDIDVRKYEPGLFLSKIELKPL